MRQPPKLPKPLYYSFVVIGALLGLLLTAMEQFIWVSRDARAERARQSYQRRRAKDVANKPESMN